MRMPSAAHEVPRGLAFESRLLEVSPAARADARRPLGTDTLLWSRQIDGIRHAGIARSAYSTRTPILGSRIELWDNVRPVRKVRIWVAADVTTNIFDAIIRQVD